MFSYWKKVPIFLTGQLATLVITHIICIDHRCTHNIVSVMLKLGDVMCRCGVGHPYCRSVLSDQIRRRKPQLINKSIRISRKSFGGHLFNKCTRLAGWQCRTVVLCYFFSYNLVLAYFSSVTTILIAFKSIKIVNYCTEVWLIDLKTPAVFRAPALNLDLYVVGYLL